MTYAEDTRSNSESSTDAARKFGAFGGVFTPSVLTIIGVIMFMRAGFVVGRAGILHAFVILLLAKSITFFTSLSISAVATNMEIRGGGAYYLISRTLGPEFGGTIGLALFFAQTLSIPFYVLGFAEALTRTFPALSPYYASVSFGTCVVLFIVVLKGADWAIRVQYFIMAILAAAILTFLAGSALHFDKSVLLANWGSEYSGDAGSFWIVFAIYFPAATGIMAGVNMSGNLRNPMRAIPLGTIAAIAVGFLVYGAQIVLCGGANDRASLIEAPYRCLLDNALWGMWYVVACGVFAATLSSAIGSFLGAPRILQSLGQDKILAPAKPFAGTSADGEPRRALWLSLAVALVTLYYAGDGKGGAALNMLATLITMFFLWTYGIINLAAFVESFGGNPSFRPRFRLFHWSFALLGAGGCTVAAFLIDPAAALWAVALIAGIYAYVKKFVLKASFGDARRGFFYSRVCDNLFRLAQAATHPKNWRPTILVFTGNPARRLTLTQYAIWLGGGRGLVTLVGLIVGKFNVMIEQRSHLLRGLDDFISQHGFRAFPQVLITPDFDLGVNQVLQSSASGPLRPNLAVLGWPDDPARAGVLVCHVRAAKQLAMSVVLIHDHGLPPKGKKTKKRVDIWWRGMKNGSLMAILAYLMSLNSEWSGCVIRFLRVVRKDESPEEAREDLTRLVEAARLTALTEVIKASRPFAEILYAYSHDATVILLGFRTPQVDTGEEFHRTFADLARDLPTTLLVDSTGEADLTA